MSDVLKFQPDLEIDYRGDRPENKIINEPHQLSEKRVRAVVPYKGLFYGESLEVRHLSKLLVRDVDYRLEELHAKLTAKTGKAIYAGFVVFADIPDRQISITYQAVGGEYMADNAALANLFETAMLDGRPIDWDNVQNKPYEFPPVNHDHSLTDIIGFEPIIYQLERILESRTLSQVAIAKAALEGMINNYRCGELPPVLPTDKLIQHHDLLYFLTRRKEISDCWIDIVGCVWYYGQMNQFQIDTSEYPVGHLFEWSFYRKDAEQIAFPIQERGIVEGNGAVVTVDIFVPNKESRGTETIYLGVKSDPAQDEFSATTRPIIFLHTLESDSSYGQMTNVKETDTDSLTNPADYDKDKYRSEKYIDEHSSLFDK